MEHIRPVQDYLHFAAFDVTSGVADGLRSILEEWMAAAARLTAGKPFGPPTEALDEPPGYRQGESNCQMLWIWR